MRKHYQTFLQQNNKLKAQQSRFSSLKGHYIKAAMDMPQCSVFVVSMSEHVQVEFSNTHLEHSGGYFCQFVRVHWSGPLMNICL